MTDPARTPEGRHLRAVDTPAEGLAVVPVGIGPSTMSLSPPGHAQPRHILSGSSPRSRTRCPRAHADGANPTTVSAPPALHSLRRHPS
jgi:hypothetical protein